MHGTWRDTAPFNTPLYFEGENGGGGGGNEGGNNSGATTETGKETGSTEKTLPQSEVDRIVQGRVGETKRQTEEAIAKQLGVSVEEAKRIIDEHQKQSDADKTEAQRERDAAAAERTKAEAEKTAAAKERHDAAVERALLRALPKDLEDDALDKKVARISRMIDVEVGADAAAIAKAVADLKTDEPLLFGEAAPEGDGNDGKGKKIPDGDPKGKPPVKKQGEDRFALGQERAKAAAGKSTYALLDKS